MANVDVPRYRNIFTFSFEIQLRAPKHCNIAIVGRATTGNDTKRHEVTELDRKFRNNYTYV
jgi:hypothetical protein